jgi:hypothetical protein
MKDIVGLVGYMGSGKDTIANILIEKMPEYKNFKFAGCLKKFCSELYSIPMFTLESQELKSIIHEVEFSSYEEYYNAFYDSCVNILGIDNCFTVAALVDCSMKFLDSNYENPEAHTVLIKKTPREILQKIGTETFREMYDNMFWVNRLDGSQKVIVTDVRFPNEAQRIKELGGCLIRVRTNNKPNDFHESENFIEKIVCDFEIYNRKNGVKSLEIDIAAMFDLF